MRNATTKLISLLALGGLILTGLAQAQTAKIAVQVDKPGVKVSPTLYGIFFEEINRAGDGGIYGEMLENRSFEDNAAIAKYFRSQGRPGRVENAGPVYSWTINGGKMALDTAKPLNASNPTALKVELDGGAATAVNAGFKSVGLNVRDGATYLLSLYARSENFGGPLTARLESKDGKVLAEQKVEAIGKEWKKFDLALTARGTDPAARLALSASGKGSLYLDMVSLFPKATWKERKNGLRQDLMQRLVDMKPAFVRFPGGCFVEGDKLETAARWKKSIGDIAERPGHWNLWGYMSTDGLGFYEFLQMCEDLSAEPLFVINVGMSHEEQRGSSQGPKGAELQEYVQDALDAIEYCNGPVESKWGALRAAAGHPAPFNLKYMEIGNENGGPIYIDHYKLFVDAIKAKYPAMNLISNGWRGNDGLKSEIVDEHDYNTPEHFMAISNKYDKYDRQGPKIYTGEYAVTRGCGQGNLIAALGEAAFMTGMERNSDIVIMSSYAPLFVNELWREWNPNAIVYDQYRTFGTPSYHAQAMFANHRADVVLPTTVSAPKARVVKSFPGRVGVGTWNTQAEFKDIVVTGADGAVLFKSDFGPKYRIPRGRNATGQWSVAEGALRQTGNAQGAKILFGDPKWADYTLELKARKTGGAEGFLITFASTRDTDKSWWNLGGWGNQRHGLEIGGVADEKRGKIETGKWYDIKVELKGDAIKCYLDGKLVHDVSRAPVQGMYAVAGLAEGTHELILKVVNASDKPQQTELDLAGAGKLEPAGKALVMTSADVMDENSMEQPEKVAPRAAEVSGVSAKFNYTFAANSITVLRLKQAK